METKACVLRMHHSANVFNKRNENVTSTIPSRLGTKLINFYFSKIGPDTRGKTEEEIKRANEKWAADFKLYILSCSMYKQ